MFVWVWAVLSLARALLRVGASFPVGTLLCLSVHVALHSNVSAGIGGCWHKGNLVRCPAHSGQHARASLGGLGPILDGVADRHVAKNAGHNACQIGSTSGRAENLMTAVPRSPSTVALRTEPSTSRTADWRCASRTLAPCSRDKSTASGVRLNRSMYWPAMSRRRTGAPVDQITSTVRACASAEVGASVPLRVRKTVGVGNGISCHDVIHRRCSPCQGPVHRLSGQAYLCVLCRRRSPHRPVRRRSPVRKSPDFGI